MSRRLRKRGDKRDRYAGDGSPELAAAFEALLGPKEPEPEPEPDTINTTSGETVDLRRPWQLSST